MSLTHRILRVSFAMSGDGSTQSLSFTNLRMRAQITVAGSTETHLRLSIYGMTLSHMNALSYVPFLTDSVGNNTILVEAGDAESGMSTVFQGTIFLAWPNMQNAPEVSFDVEAMVGVYNGVKPANPPYLSFSGPTDVATAAQKIAGLHDPPLTFENNGVNLQIDSPYFWGSPRNMMHQLGKITRMGWIEENGKLAIWPQQGSRTSAGTQIISAQTGMVGYPAAVPGYIVVKKLFDRAVPYASQVTVQSDIQRACGSWTVWYVNYELENYLMPHNRWFTTLFCSKLGASAPPPPAGG